MTFLPVPPLLRQARAIADPTRWGLLRLLAGGERCVCELTDATGLPQPLLSFHLKVLRLAGLIADRRFGRWSYYSVRPAALRALATAVSRLAPPATPRRRAPSCG